MTRVKDGVAVQLSSDLYMMQIKMLQDRINELEAANSKQKEKKHSVASARGEYSDYKSDGIRKPHAADSIRSYGDFKAIQDYFLSKNDVRDWAMWTIGVCLGLRVSDLLSLRFCNLLENDKKTFKKRIEIYEKKTGKQNNLLITEAVRDALDKYIKSLNGKFDLGGYLFASRKTGGKMYEEHGWRILSNAGKALGLPLNIGSHTMRKSFANIAACVDRSSVDMNSITKVQGLLNHSDQRVTMKYLGTFQDMYDRARIAVSDFALGRTSVDQIVAGTQHSVDDIIARLEALETILSPGR